MVTQTWLYDAIIYIYALSLLFYFSDFVVRTEVQNGWVQGCFLLYGCCKRHTWFTAW